MSIEKVYGICLLSDADRGRKIFQAIDKSWLVTDFQRRVYDALGRMYKGTQEPNIVTLVNEMKNQGGIQKDVILKISQLTNGLSGIDVMHVNSILGSIDMEYRERKAIQVVQSLNQILTERGFDIPGIKAALNRGLEICDISTQIKKESNIDLIFHLVDKHDKARAGELGGIKLPYRSLDEVILLEDVDLMVIGARPAMGKTAFVVSTATRMALEGKKVVIFALEMSREQVMRRVVANITGVDSNVIKYGRCNKYQIDLIYRVQEMPELENLVIIEGSQTVSDIARYIQAEQPDIAFVDYLQKIKPEGTSDLYTAVTRASNGLKELCQNLHIPIVAMAQLSRPDATRAGKRPSLPDLRQSGEIEQDASIVAFLHRPEYYGEAFLDDGITLAANMAELIVAKNREGEVGIYTMEVSLKTSRFKDYGTATVIHTQAPPVPSQEPGTQSQGIQFTIDENPF